MIGVDRECVNAWASDADEAFLNAPEKGGEHELVSWIQILPFSICSIQTFVY